MLLKQQMLPVMLEDVRVTSNTVTVLLVTRTSSSRIVPQLTALSSVQLLQQGTTEFIAPDPLLPNSPDLNPVTTVSGVSCRNEFTRLQCVTQLNDLKQCLTET